MFAHLHSGINIVSLMQASDPEKESGYLPKTFFASLQRFRSLHIVLC